MEELKRNEREIEQRRFEYMARAFFERWQPKDPDDAAQFSAEFYMMVREIYHDAVVPAMQQMTELMKAIPTVGLFK